MALSAAAAAALVAALALGPSGRTDEASAREPARPAPEFTGIERWRNSEPLSMAGLRGKVVLVEFWTFACSNCVHMLPFVSKWHDAYAKRGLVVVGVHTPETQFEQLDDPLERALARHRISYPVAQDNAYATWKAWDNHYWPALYLVDRRGNVVFSHFGEGDTETIEAAIVRLLEEPA
ncbi:MAG: redoxin family protein [Myxococcota bacterium]